MERGASGIASDRLESYQEGGGRAGRRSLYTLFTEAGLSLHLQLMESG